MAMRIVPRWKVVLTFEDRNVELWMDDNHLSNVLHKLADIHFSERPIEQPKTCLISLVSSELDATINAK